MSELGNEFIASARRRVNLPFRSHFRPVNKCASGQVTLDQCMERGLDDEGFDCSGLVIASLAEVLSINPKSWPRQYRHAQQLMQLAEEKAPSPGDIRINSLFGSQPHIGIVASESTIIHASGVSRTVDVDVIVDAQYTSILSMKTIAVESLYQMLKANDVIHRPYLGG